MSYGQEMLKELHCYNGHMITRPTHPI